MILAVNGSLLDEREAVVSAYDHGFLYGIGLFETFRTYGGSPFLLDEHLERLNSGCETLGIKARLDSDTVNGWIASLLEANSLADAYFRLSVSAGEEALGLPTGQYGRPNVILYAKKLPPALPAACDSGKPLQLLRLRRNTPEGDVRLKSFHYMNNVLAKRELASYPWASGAEGLFLDGSGRVAEGIVSNLFFVEKGTCCTPGLATGILPGITRACVLNLLKRLAIRAEEGFYSWDRLLAAEEIFVTNSIQEIVPVTRLYDPEGRETTVGNGQPGPVARRLAEAYRELAWRR